MTYEQAIAMLKGYRANVIGDWCDLFDIAIECINCGQALLWED